jgi:hypothetical protein
VQKQPQLSGIFASRTTGYRYRVFASGGVVFKVEVSDKSRETVLAALKQAGFAFTLLATYEYTPPELPYEHGMGEWIGAN